MWNVTRFCGTRLRRIFPFFYILTKMPYVTYSSISFSVHNELKIRLLSLHSTWQDGTLIRFFNFDAARARKIPVGRPRGEALGAHVGVHEVKPRPSRPRGVCCQGPASWALDPDNWAAPRRPAKLPEVQGVLLPAKTTVSSNRRGPRVSPLQGRRVFWPCRRNDAQRA